MKKILFITVLIMLFALSIRGDSMGFIQNTEDKMIAKLQEKFRHLK